MHGVESFWPNCGFGALSSGLRVFGLRAKGCAHTQREALCMMSVMP